MSNNGSNTAAATTTMVPVTVLSGAVAALLSISEGSESTSTQVGAGAGSTEAGGATPVEVFHGWDVATMNVCAALSGATVNPFEFHQTDGSPMDSPLAMLSHAKMCALALWVRATSVGELVARIKAYETALPAVDAKTGKSLPAFERKARDELMALDEALTRIWYDVKEFEKNTGAVNHRRFSVLHRPGGVAAGDIESARTLDEFRSLWIASWNTDAPADHSDRSVPYLYGIKKATLADVEALMTYDYITMAALSGLMMAELRHVDSLNPASEMLDERIAAHFVAELGRPSFTYADYKAIVNTADQYNHAAKARLVTSLLNKEAPQVVCLQESHPGMLAEVDTTGYTVHGGDGPSVILTRNSCGEFEVMPGVPNINGETMVVANDVAMIAVICAHLTSSGDKAGQWTEMKALIAELEARGYKVILGIDANQDVSKSLPDGVTCSKTGPSSVKKRTALQAQANKAEEVKNSKIDFIVVSRDLEVIVSTLWTNGLETSAPTALIPHPEYPTDHKTVISLVRIA